MNGVRFSLPLVAVLASLAACGAALAPSANTSEPDVVVRDETAADGLAQLDALEVADVADGRTYDHAEFDARDAADATDAAPAAREDVCAEGSVPSGAGCVCADGFLRCNGLCLDVRRDPRNCGACGRGCDAQDCVDGMCLCAPGHTLCRAACVDIARDPMHCGRCLNECPRGQTCRAAVCG